MTVTRIGEGVYRVEHDRRSDTVYVAVDSRNGRWAFWNGLVFRSTHVEETASGVVPGAPARNDSRPRFHQPLTAPMPATVLQVLVAPGSAVKKGDTVVLLEAMKMELPIRAPADATVRAVNCREGELVQPETVLIELE